MKLIKRSVLVFLFVFLTLALSACSFFGGNTDNTKTPTLAFSEANVELVVDETYTLNPNIGNLSGTDLVSYSIDVEGIISLNGNVVTALRVGEANVTASLKGYENITATIKIIVKAKTEERVLASIGEEQRGTYSNEAATIVVLESKLTIKVNNIETEYNLYQDDKGIYFVETSAGVDVKVYISFYGYVLVTKDGNYNKEGTTDRYAKANLDVIYQGEFFGGNIKIVVGRDSVTVYDGESPMVFTLYMDNYGIFVIDEHDGKEEKIYCTISENQISNKMGTFTRKGSGEEYTKANIEAKYQGEYFGSGVKVEVGTDNVKLTFETGNTLTYALYVDNNGIFFLEGEEKVYCTFTDTEVINSKGTFTRKTTETYTKANLEAKYQGEFFGGNIKIVVGRDSVTVYDGESPMVFTLYIDDNGIFVVDEHDGKEEKIYCTISENQISNKMGTFTRKGSSEEYTKANLEAKYQGEFFGGNIKIVVSSDSVTVYDGESPMVFTLYIDNEGIFVVDEHDGKEEKIYCTITEDSVVNKMGTFTRKGSGEEYTKANIEAKYQGEYFGSGVKVEVGSDNVKLTFETGSTLTYTLYVDDNGIFFLEGEEKVYCTITEDSVVNKMGTFTRKSSEEYTKANLEAKYQGEFFGGNIKIVVGRDSVTVYDGESPMVFTLYIDNEGIFVVDEHDGKEEKIYCTISENQISNKMGTFTRKGSSEEYTKANLEAKYQGEFFGGDIKIVVSSDSVTVYDGESPMVFTLYIDDNGIFVVDEHDGKEEKIYCTISENQISNKMGTFTRKGTSEEYTVANIPVDIQGAYGNEMILIIVSENECMVIDANVIKYTIYEDNEGYFFIQDENKMYCKFGGNAVSNAFGTFAKLEGEYVFASIDEEQQGVYKNDHYILTLSENSFTVADYSGRTWLQMIYLIEEKYYFFQNNVPNGYSNELVIDGDTIYANGMYFYKEYNLEDFDLYEVPEEYYGVYAEEDGEYAVVINENGIYFYEEGIMEGYIATIDNDLYFILIYQGRLEKTKTAFNEDGTITIFAEDGEITLYEANLSDIFEDVPYATPEEYQGMYVGSKGTIITIKLGEIVIGNKESEGDSEDLYVDNEGVYFYTYTKDEDEVKCYINFDPNTLVIGEETYIKIITSEENLASIAEENRGKYYFAIMVATIEEAKIIIQSGEESMEYPIYYINSCYIIVIENEAAVIEFTEEGLDLNGLILTRDDPTIYETREWPAEVIAKAAPGMNVPAFVSEKGTYSGFVSFVGVQIKLNNVSPLEIENYARNLVEAGFRYAYSGTYMKAGDDCSLTISIDYESMQIMFMPTLYTGDYSEWPDEEILEVYGISIPAFNAKGYYVYDYSIVALGAKVEDYENYLATLEENGFKPNEKNERYVKKDTEKGVYIYVGLDYSEYYRTAYIYLEVIEIPSKVNTPEEYRKDYISNEYGLRVTEDKLLFLSPYGSVFYDLYQDSKSYCVFYDNDIEESEKERIVIEFVDGIIILNGYMEFNEGNPFETMEYFTLTASKKYRGKYVNGESFIDIGSHYLNITGDDNNQNGSEIYLDDDLNPYVKIYDYYEGTYNTIYIEFLDDSIKYGDEVYEKISKENASVATLSLDMIGTYYEYNKVYEIGESAIRITNLDTQEEYEATIYSINSLLFFESEMRELCFISVIEDKVVLESENERVILSVTETYSGMQKSLPKEFIQGYIDLDLPDYNVSSEDGYMFAFAYSDPYSDSVSIRVTAFGTSENEYRSFLRGLNEKYQKGNYENSYVLVTKEAKVEIYAYQGEIEIRIDYFKAEYEEWQNDLVYSAVPILDANAYYFYVTEKEYIEITALGMVKKDEEDYRAALIEAGFDHNSDEDYYTITLAKDHVDLVLEVSYDEYDYSIRISIWVCPREVNILEDLPESFSLEYTADNYSYVVVRMGDTIYYKEYIDGELSQKVIFTKSTLSNDSITIYSTIIKEGEMSFVEGYQSEMNVSNYIIYDRLNPDNYKAPEFTQEEDEEYNGVMCSKYTYDDSDSSILILIGKEDNLLYRFKSFNEYYETGYEVKITSLTYENVEIPEEFEEFNISAWDEEVVNELYPGITFPVLPSSKYVFIENKIFALDLDEESFNAALEKQGITDGVQIINTDTSHNTLEFYFYQLYDFEEEGINGGYAEIYVTMEEASSFPSIDMEDMYGETFPHFETIGYFEEQIAGELYVLWDGTSEELTNYYALLEENGIHYSEEKGAYILDCETFELQLVITEYYDYTLFEITSEDYE